MQKLFSLKNVKRVVLALLLGYSLFLLWWVWSAGPKTVWRIISHDSSSIEDYKLFPARPLTAATSPFHFAVGEDESRVPKLVSVAGRTNGR